MYAETCDKNGEMYKKTTLTTYRQGIQRHLDAMRDDKIDIVKGSEFSTSAKIFGGVVKQMKREGKAAVDHHQFISDADLEALYAYLGSLRANDSVTGDGEGTLYAYKVKDELTKNHKTDDAKSEGRMYEIKGNLMSFLLNRMIIDTLYNVYVFSYD